jgi:radical SAM superfamily enzyme YgiQ (UPF0313 family)
MARLLFLQNLEYEFLGPMYISALVKQRHECKLLMGNDYDDFRDGILSFKPDIIGFSVMTGQHRWAVKTAKAVKQRHEVLTLFGGPHPTFFPECVRDDGVDIICRGEGEEAVLELLDNVDARRDITGIPNMVVKRDGGIVSNDVRALNKNLDCYPFADRQLYRSLKGNADRSIVNVITSRGCVYNCSFCFEENMRKLYEGKGSFVRVRAIDSVIEELALLKKDGDARTIYFCDDVFGINKKWLYEFLGRYKKEIGIDFICLVRADVVCSDEAYAGKLREAGCKSVFFGIETGSNTLRNKVLNKNLDDKHIYQAARFLHGAGIKFRTYNILGLPDETLQDAFATVQMNIDIKADYPWCSLFSPYPRTALARYACSRGYIDESLDPDSLPQSFFIESKLNIANIREIENLQKMFQTAVLWPWTFAFVKQLIKLPPNVFFRAWFSMIYFYVYVRSEKRGFFKTLVFGLRNWKHVVLKG